MLELSGGFINSCYLKKSGKTKVIKIYDGEELLDKSTHERLTRERLALLKFGNSIAPALLGFTDESLEQEYIEGILVENLPEKPFYEIGRLLKQVHIPVRRNPKYLREDFESRFRKNLAKASQHFDLSFVSFDINWEEVFEWGTTRIHRDFWLGNVIQTNNGKLCLIDWELSGIGSPFEDFAIAELWIFMEYGGREEFYSGYGKKPNQEIVIEFLKAKCISFLATYKGDDPIGFYKNKLEVLQQLHS